MQQIKDIPLLLINQPTGWPFKNNPFSIKKYYKVTHMLKNFIKDFLKEFIPLEID